MAKFSLIALFHFVLTLGGKSVTCITAAENNLAEYLLNSTRYNPGVRPVNNYSETLTVRHGVTLAQLIKLDEKNQVITTRIVIKMKWNDVKLIWDPSLYDGITEFNVDVSLIWIPQIELFNNADDSLDSIAIPRAIVRYDGSVTAVFPRILKSTCPISVKDFPFDQQMCMLRFGSFQFDTLHMDVQPLSDKIVSHVGMTLYQENGGWVLGKTRVEYGRVFHAFSNTTEFAQISYKLILRRKPLYYVANFLIPCVLIALITILLFLIPADTGEQMAVGVTILLSMAVFFLLLEEKMPETSDFVPLIGKYFACTVVEISLAVAATCMMLCFHHHDATEVPLWMKKWILVKLATWLRIKTSENELQTGPKRGTVMQRLKNRSNRRTDNFAVEVARSHLLIWQAKAKAKRLRREKAEQEEKSHETLITNLSDESPAKVLANKEQINRKGSQPDEEKKKEKRRHKRGRSKEKEGKKDQNQNKKEKDGKKGNDVEGKSKGKEKKDRDGKREAEDVSKNQKEKSEGDDRKHREKSDRESRKHKEKSEGDNRKHKEKSEGDNRRHKEKKQNLEGENEKSKEKKSRKLKEGKDKEIDIGKAEEESENNLKKKSDEKESKEKKERKEKHEEGKVKKESRKDRPEGGKEQKQVNKEKVSTEKPMKKVETDIKDNNKEKAVKDQVKKEKERKEKSMEKEKSEEKAKSKEAEKESKEKSQGQKESRPEIKKVAKDNDDKSEEKTKEQGKENKMKETSSHEGDEAKAESSTELVVVEGQEDVEGDEKQRVGKWVRLTDGATKEEKSNARKLVKSISNKFNSSKNVEESEKTNDNCDLNNEGKQKCSESQEPTLPNQREDSAGKDDLLEVDLTQDNVEEDKKEKQEQSLGQLETEHNSDNMGSKLEAKVDGDEAKQITTVSVCPDMGSTSSIRSCDDDTRILIPSPRRPSALLRRSAAKQFKLVDRVVRIKDTLTDRLNKAKAPTKQEPVVPPPPTAAQRSAKKLGNASDWEEAEHESVKLMAHTIQETDAGDQLRTKWKEVGKVINNLIMWVYIISIVLTFFVFFGPVFVADELDIK